MNTGKVGLEKGKLRINTTVNFRMSIREIRAIQVEGSATRYFGPESELDIPREFENEVRKIIIKCDFEPRRPGQPYLTECLLKVLKPNFLRLVEYFVEDFIKSRRKEIGYNFSLSDNTRALWDETDPYLKMEYDRNGYNITSICVEVTNDAFVPHPPDDDFEG